MVLAIRFLALDDFCGSPSAAEYCIPPRIREMTAMSPTSPDMRSRVG